MHCQEGQEAVGEIEDRSEPPVATRRTSGDHGAEQKKRGLSEQSRLAPDSAACSSEKATRKLTIYCGECTYV